MDDAVGLSEINKVRKTVPSNHTCIQEDQFVTVSAALVWIISVDWIWMGSISDLQTVHSLIHYLDVN